MKFLLPCIIALGMGFVAGALLYRAQLQAELQELLLQNQQLERETQQLRQEVHQARATRAHPPEDPTTPAPYPATPGLLLPDGFDAFDTPAPDAEDALSEGMLMDLLALFDPGEPLPRSMLDTTLAEHGAARDGATEAEIRDALLEQLERERLARQRASANRTRQDMLNFLRDQARASNNPAEQERLAAIADYYDAIFDLRRQMQNAQTDAQHEALRGMFRENVAGMNRLMRAQQNHMLQQVARQFGVTGAQRQRHFTNALRETYQSPFFNPNAPKTAPKLSAAQRGG